MEKITLCISYISTQIPNPQDCFWMTVSKLLLLLAELLALQDF